MGRGARHFQVAYGRDSRQNGMSIFNKTAGGAEWSMLGLLLD
jgi:hypothetical protein